MSARNKLNHPAFQKKWENSGAITTIGTTTPLKYSDSLLIHGPISQKLEKWPVLETRGARTGFDEEGKPVQNWGQPVPKLKIRFGKMALRKSDGGIMKFERTFVVEVHYDKALSLHCLHMWKHPLGSFGSMVCMDFVERSEDVMEKFFRENGLRVVQKLLDVPFVRVVAERAPVKS